MLVDYAGNFSSIIIDGVENSTNEQGLNVVVYDKKQKRIVDVENFNT